MKTLLSILMFMLTVFNLDQNYAYNSIILESFKCCGKKKAQNGRSSNKNVYLCTADWVYAFGSG